MKRKRRPGKLTSSELAAAGHTDLANHCRQQLAKSIERAKAHKPVDPTGRSIHPHRRYLVP
jgi:hypothetical protein